MNTPTTHPPRDPATAYLSRKLADAERVNRDDLDGPAPEIAIDANLGGDMLLRINIVKSGGRND